MRVIGTAGHVDHGKSTLIEALTGTHPDRLKEEQAREMTIELGFGWMTLPSGEEVGIVDVPGHRDFIENMLSGIGGVDAALLIIAADEGVMPQTREHLAILDLLQIPAGLIVLTKTDLASDSAWLDLVETDIRSAVADTVLQDSPIIRVSAKQRTGIDILTAQLAKILEEKPSRPDLSRPRLPVDRAFTMSGFGTVVTGTLSDGRFSVGDEVEILPSGISGRIRGLQTHKKKEDMAVPGSRTAINISGVNMEQINRGDVVAHVDQYHPTRRLDARLRLLKDVSNPVTHGQEVKFFVGASETIGTVRLLGTEELKSGEKGWIQLELREPVIAVRGDRYILRRPSPGETLGGGAIIDPAPKGRHKRFDETVLKTLESLAQGSPAEILLEAATGAGITTVKELVVRSHLDEEKAEAALQEGISSGNLVLLEDGEIKISSQLPICSLSYWNEIKERTINTIETFHKTYPLRRGMQKEELKSKLKLSPRHYAAMIKKLVVDETLVDLSSLLAMPGHRIQFNGQEQVKVQTLMRTFEQNPFSPLSVKECEAEAGQEIINALIEMNELLPVSADVIFRKKDYDHMVKVVCETIIENGSISLAQVRDIFKTSRKFAQALLEHLDGIGVTKRDGDLRRLK